MRWIRVLIKRGSAVWRPELRGLGTRVHAEVLRSGNILLFDYRKRDPLTHNAEMSCLEPEKQPRSSEGVCQAASLF